jgi:hypothetical protein
MAGVVALGASRVTFGPLHGDVPAHAAKHLERSIAARRRRDVRLKRLHDPDRARLDLADFHEARSRAQLERVERVELCGTGQVAIGCTHRHCAQRGKHGQIYRTRCQAWRYCVSCRGLRCARERRRLVKAMTAHRRRWHREMRRDHRPGRWSSKFLTFTVPHSGSVARDFAILQIAMRVLRKRVVEWLVNHRDITEEQKRFPYVRVFEATDSDGGHAHCHVWMISPYLPHQVLRVLWGRALINAGATNVVHADIDWIRQNYGQTDLDLADIETVATCRRKRTQLVPWPVIDVRAERTDSSTANELAKYMTKDMRGDDLIDPAVYATIIEATEGLRMLTASRAFWVLEESHACGSCGWPLQLITVVPATRPSSRGPPPPSLPVS